MKFVFPTQIDKNRLQLTCDLPEFHRVIQRYSSLSHRYVISLVDYIEDASSGYMVLELARNGTLAAVINSHLSETQCRQYFLEMCLGVRYLHSSGLIHRAIRPSNLLISSENHIKISHFTSSIRLNTTQNTYYGPIEYMPPEIMQGQEQTQAVDIWSLGAVLYEMTHGHRLIETDTGKEYCRKILARDWIIDSDLSEELQRLLDMILQVEPGNRPDIDTILAQKWMNMELDETILPPLDTHNAVSGLNSLRLSVGSTIKKLTLPPFESNRPEAMLKRSYPSSPTGGGKGWGNIQSDRVEISVVMPAISPRLSAIPAKHLDESPSFSASLESSPLPILDLPEDFSSETSRFDTFLETEPDFDRANAPPVTLTLQTIPQPAVYAKKSLSVLVYGGKDPLSSGSEVQS